MLHKRKIVHRLVHSVRLSGIQWLYSTRITQSSHCWNCGTEKPSTDIQFQCSKCQSLLDLPKNVNHFELLKTDKKFNIDTSELTNTFRKMQSVLHPDKFSNRLEKDQQLSAEWSSLVNKAYKILLSPIQRAEYLLKLYDVHIPEGNTATNSEFLIKMMERNEEVEEAETEDDLIKLLKTVREDCEACIKELETSLAANDLPAAKSQVIILRYLISLEKSIKDKGNRINVFL